MVYRKCCTSNEDNQNLTTYDDELYAHEPVIFEHSFENVEVIVEASAIVLVEDLHPYECIEYRGL